jgi:hypothetical protein
VNAPLLHTSSELLWRSKPSHEVLDACAGVWALDVKIGTIAKERMIHSVREDEPVITGFRKMLSANVSGIAVLDKNGDLADVLSLRDLRGITPTAEDLIRLWRPVSQYKFEIRSKYPKQSAHLTPACQLKPGATSTRLTDVGTHVVSVACEQARSSPICF